MIIQHLTDYQSNVMLVGAWTCGIASLAFTILAIRQWIRGEHK